MEPGLVKIVTSTLYDSRNEVDRVRIGLAERSIGLSTEKGYEVILVDGGSEDKVVRRFEKAGALVSIQKEPGIGPGRREAIRYALDRKPEVVVWMEPEKVDFVRFIGELTNYFSQEIDLVMPERVSLSSYPRFQQKTETIGNEFFRQATGINLDIYFGPSLWRPRVANYFLDYDTRNGDMQDSIIIPPINMILAGVKAKFVKVDFAYEPSQRDIEEGNLEINLKRIRQLHLLSNVFAKSRK